MSNVYNVFLLFYNSPLLHSHSRCYCIHFYHIIFNWWLFLIHLIKLWLLTSVNVWIYTGAVNWNCYFFFALKSMKFCFIAWHICRWFHWKFKTMDREKKQDNSNETIHSPHTNVVLKVPLLLWIGSVFWCTNRARRLSHFDLFRFLETDFLIAHLYKLLKFISQWNHSIYRING